MQRIYAAANLPEAHLLMQQLQGAKIRAHVFNQHAQSAVGEVPFTHAYPEVWIERECDLERAKIIVSRFEKTANVDVIDIDCPACGETNPNTFQICWSCATTLSLPEW